MPSYPAMLNTYLGDKKRNMPKENQDVIIYVEEVRRQYNMN